MTKILTIIVNYRTPELAEKCLEALANERSGNAGLSAIMVDGNSGDGSAERLAGFLTRTGFDGWTALLPLDFNGGFGWANNQAILSRGADLPDYIYLLNPDAEVTPGAVASLAAVLDTHPRVAAVGSQLIEADGAPAASAFRFPSAGREFVRGSQTFALHRLLGIPPIVLAPREAGPVDWVTGASVMLRRDALTETGLFDDGFFLYFEEVELMRRLTRAGWQIWCEPQSRVRHIGGASTGVDGTQARKAKPAYWFASRNRYFARSGGAAYACLANLAWLSGFALIGGPRMLLSRTARANAPVGETRGIIKEGIWPAARHRRASVTEIGSAFGRLPRWAEDG